MDYVIGCDLGSRRVKVVLLTAEGQSVGEASAGYVIDYSFPAWAEQNACLWTGAICEGVRKVLATTAVLPERITAIGLDAQVDGVVQIDAFGNPLRPMKRRKFLSLQFSIFNENFIRFPYFFL